MKILVISSHPDDLEISCSGTLKKYQEQGADIVSIITVAPSGEDNPRRNQLGVEEELAASYNYSKFELRVFKTELHNNGRPNLVVDNVTMTKLSRLIEPCDLAIISNVEDYHQDHRNTYHLVFPLLRNKAREIRLMYSAPYCHYHTSLPNLYVDISAQWEFKEKLIRHYRSYFTDDMIQNIKVSNQYWGQPINAKLAEAFKVVYKNE